MTGFEESNRCLLSTSIWWRECGKVRYENSDFIMKGNNSPFTQYFTYFLLTSLAFHTPNLTSFFSSATKSRIFFKISCSTSRNERASDKLLALFQLVFEKNSQTLLWPFYRHLLTHFSPYFPENTHKHIHVWCFRFEKDKKSKQNNNTHHSSCEELLVLEKGQL